MGDSTPTGGEASAETACCRCLRMHHFVQCQHMIAIRRYLIFDKMQGKWNSLQWSQEGLKDVPEASPSSPAGDSWSDGPRHGC